MRVRRGRGGMTGVRQCARQMEPSVACIGDWRRREGDAAGVRAGAVERANAKRVRENAANIVMDVDDVEVKAVGWVHPLVLTGGGHAGVKQRIVALTVVGDGSH